MKTRMNPGAAELRQQTMAAKEEWQKAEREWDGSWDGWLVVLEKRERHLTLADKRA